MDTCENKELIPAFDQSPTPPAPPVENGKELISTWGFVGIFLLLSIPVVGPILTIIWALGGCKKKQKRYFARSLIVLALIGLLLTGLLALAVTDAVRDAAEGMGLPRNASIEEIIETAITQELEKESDRIIEEMMGELSEGEIPLTEDDINAMNELFGNYLGEDSPLTEEDIGNLIKEFEASGGTIPDQLIPSA